MTEQEIKLIKVLWESGKGVGEIARLLPYKEYIGKRQIQEMKRNGILQGRSGKSQANIQGRVLKAYQGGITNPYEIAEVLQMDVRYVNGILTKAKLNRQRPKHNYRQRKLCANTQAIITALRSGKRVREICDEFGVSSQYVYQVKDKFVKEQ